MPTRRVGGRSHRSGRRGQVRRPQPHGPKRLIRWSRHGRVLVAEPGREFTFVTEEGRRESTQWRYQFDPVEGGTRVTEAYDVKWLPLWARIIDGPLNRRRELHDNMCHTLAQLKTAAEKTTVAEDTAR